MPKSVRSEIIKPAQAYCCKKLKTSTSGFTLVELLVVIGIIALLIGILLPSLTRARQAAQRTTCAVKLQQMMIAAQAHASDHQGYFPLAGILGHLTPPYFGDMRTNRYDYYQYDAYPANYVLAPITLALAKEMSVVHSLNTIDADGFVKLSLDPNGFIRNFVCPSQTSGTLGIPAAAVYSGSINNYDVFCMQSQSYVFNEAVLGYDDGFGRLRGKATSIHQTSKTMFAADGLGGLDRNGRTTSWEKDDSAADGFRSMATIYNNIAFGPLTLGDALGGVTFHGLPVVGDAQSLDKIRHQGKINVAFCDGHVETLTISAKGLAAVYILPP